jgi:hypothetical protein
MNRFIEKCIVVTICVAILLYFFYPRYEKIGDHYRFDKVKGIVESF